MNRDHFLFAIIGLLMGFISGYLMHDVVASRQPPRLTPEMRAQIGAAEGPNGGGAMGAPAEGGGDPSQGQAPAAGGGAFSPEVQQLRGALEKNPNDTEALRRLGDLNFDIRDWKRAVDLYGRYLTLKPGDPDVLTDLGIALRETKQYDEALKRFAEAQKIAPDHWQSYYNEVVVLAFDLKQLDRANQVLAKLQQLQPGNPDVARLATEVAKQKSAA